MVKGVHMEPTSYFPAQTLHWIWVTGALHTGPWIRIRCTSGIRIQRLLCLHMASIWIRAACYAPLDYIESGSGIRIQWIRFQCPLESPIVKVHKKKQNKTKQNSDVRKKSDVEFQNCDKTTIWNFMTLTIPSKMEKKKKKKKPHTHFPKGIFP